MGIEHDKKNEQKTVRPHIKETVDRGFSGGRKLYGDRYNSFGWLQGYATSEKIKNIPLKHIPLHHYREDMEASHYELDEIEYVMKLSDPVAVATFNQYIDEFNADLERIIREKDTLALRRFLERGKELIYKKG